MEEVPTPIECPKALPASVRPSPQLIGGPRPLHQQYIQIDPQKRYSGADDGSHRSSPFLSCTFLGERLRAGPPCQESLLVQDFCEASRSTRSFFIALFSICRTRSSTRLPRRLKTRCATS